MYVYAVKRQKVLPRETFANIVNVNFTALRFARFACKVATCVIYVAAVNSSSERPSDML